MDGLSLRIKERKPELTVLMISHCRAISFIDNVMQYNHEAGEMETRPYRSYDCFTALDDCEPC